MTIKTEIQKPNLDALVELFELDCSSFGGSVYRFTPNVNEGLTSVTFNGQTWTPLPIVAEGFSFSTTEAPAKPSLTLSNVNKIMLSAVISLGDIVGAKVTRYRTLRRFLGDGVEPNGQAVLPVDVWFVERKEVHNKNVIKWTLTSELNKFNTRCPKRDFLRRDFPGLSNTRFRM